VNEEETKARRGLVGGRAGGRKEERESGDGGKRGRGGRASTGYIGPVYFGSWLSDVVCEVCFPQFVILGGEEGRKEGRGKKEGMLLRKERRKEGYHGKKRRKTSRESQCRGK
jgi:hypothetical protein